jgi:hypothetical protein
MQPLIIVGQDEMLYRFIFGKSWKGPRARALILPREEGEEIMVNYLHSAEELGVI